MSRMRGSLGVTVDVDSVTAHLDGYGIKGVADDSVYRIAIPRILDLFDDLGVRATFFLIASEAERFPNVVQHIAAAGHEIGCHSMTHPQPLDLSDHSSIVREIVDAKTLLEGISQRSVYGFRAPGWGVSRALFDSLSDAGYVYDASSYPSWMLYLLRLSVSRRGNGENKRAPVQLRQVLFDRTESHIVEQAVGRIVEIPVSTVPLLRVPIYHTIRFLMPRVIFNALATVLRQRNGALTYAFHAVDFLDLQADGIDQRMRRHPGMDWSLSDKLGAAHESLGLLSAKRQFAPLKEIAMALLVR